VKTYSEIAAFRGEKPTRGQSPLRYGKRCTFSGVVIAFPRDLVPDEISLLKLDIPV